MLQLLSRSKLIVQFVLISVAILVSFFSQPAAYTEKEMNASVKSEWKDSLLFQVGFIPSDTSQLKELIY